MKKSKSTKPAAPEKAKRSVRIELDELTYCALELRAHGNQRTVTAEARKIIMDLLAPNMRKGVR